MAAPPSKKRIHDNPIRKPSIIHVKSVIAKDSIRPYSAQIFKSQRNRTIVNLYRMGKTIQTPIVTSTSASEDPQGLTDDQFVQQELDEYSTNFPVKETIPIVLHIDKRNF